MTRIFNGVAGGITLLALIVMLLPTYTRVWVEEEETLTELVTWHDFSLPLTLNVFPAICLIATALALIAVLVGLFKTEIVPFSLSALWSATVAPIVGHLIFDGLEGWAIAVPVLTGVAALTLSVGLWLVDRATAATERLSTV